jgi:hypothetical protein
VLCFFQSNTAIWLGSMNRGLGLGVISFDFNVILQSAGLGSVLVVPFVYTLNKLASCFLYLYILTPIFSTYNIFNRPNLTSANPAMSMFPDGSHFTVQPTSALYNGTGNQFRVSAMLNSKFELDMEKYERMKPIYITDLFALNYFSSFMTLAAMLSHVVLWHGRKISQQFKGKFQPRCCLMTESRNWKAYE